MFSLKLIINSQKYVIHRYVEDSKVEGDKSDDLKHNNIIIYLMRESGWEGGMNLS